MGEKTLIQNHRLINEYTTLKYAKLKMTIGEYFPLVIYKSEEQLPKEYVPIADDVIKKHFTNPKELFATVNSEINFAFLIDNNRVHKINKLNYNGKEFSYLLKDTSTTFLLSNLIEEQLNNYQYKENIRKLNK